MGKFNLELKLNAEDYCALQWEDGIQLGNAFIPLIIILMIKAYLKMYV